MNKIKTYEEFINRDELNQIDQIYDETSNNYDLVNEMAYINHKDNSNSPLNPGSFKVDVLNKEGNKEPHFHIISKSEGFNIRIRIKDGTLLSVKSYGRRDGNDKFKDIVKLAQEWLPLKSPAALNKLTNQEFAYVQFFTMNPDSPFNKESNKED